MNRELLDQYLDELTFLREAGLEFARENPRQAALLAPDATAVADPFVERLLEGTAFLTARVQQTIKRQFPRFTQGLLAMAYPLAVSPVPSMAVVQFMPRPGSTGPTPVSRGTVLRSPPVGRFSTRCTFRTAHDLIVWPVDLTEARYYARDLAMLELPENVPAKSALRLRLRTANGAPFKGQPLSSLTVFLTGDGVRMRLLEKLVANSIGVFVQEPGTRTHKWREVIREPVRPLGYSSDEALLPVDPRTFSGHRLIAEYFAFPERFLFAQLAGLESALAKCEGPEADVIVAFDASDPWLEPRVNTDHFQLNCTPIVNLFETDCDRILVDSRKSGYTVVPDRSRPGDLEVWKVDEVRGFTRRMDTPIHFEPFYAARGISGEADMPYFDVHRQTGAGASHVARSEYCGTEVKLSIVDPRRPPHSSDLVQLAVRATCTNRDLPMLLHPGSYGHTAATFTADTAMTVGPIRCVAGPTIPMAVDFGGERSWKLINHLTVNYLSLSDHDGAALRQMLRLYAGEQGNGAQLVEAVRGLQAEPCTRRVRAPGPVVYARGLTVKLTLDEAAFEGGTSFLLGSVLERFFGTYASINSFVETVLCGQERGELMRWPARSGTRPLI